MVKKPEKAGPFGDRPDPTRMLKMRIRMLKDQLGSPDGILVAMYKKSTDHDLPDKLAEIFISMGVAEILKEEKAMSKSPENKMMPESPENKTEEIEPDQQFVGYRRRPRVPRI